MSAGEAGIRVVNYPPSAPEATIRPVGFGVGEKINVLIEIGDAEGDELDIAITVGGGPEHDELAAFLTDLAELLTVIAPRAAEEIKAELGKRS